MVFVPYEFSHIFSISISSGIDGYYTLPYLSSTKCINIASAAPTDKKSISYLLIIIGILDMMIIQLLFLYNFHIVRKEQLHNYYHGI